MIESDSGWSIKLVPSGDHLKNQFVGKNVLVSCAVDGYDGSASDVQVKWLKDGDTIKGGR